MKFRSLYKCKVKSTEVQVGLPRVACARDQALVARGGSVSAHLGSPYLRTSKRADNSNLPGRAETPSFVHTYRSTKLLALLPCVSLESVMAKPFEERLALEFGTLRQKGKDLIFIISSLKSGKILRNHVVRLVDR